jgi:hypothetical protein
VFSTVRSQFLVELQRRGVADLAELNALFATWVETVYHRRRRSVAENVALSLTTGAQVLVTGRLQSRNWETEDGQKRSAVEIEAEEVAASLVAEGAGQTYARPGVTRKAS